MDLAIKKRDLFADLPEELTIDILGRLPTKSILRYRYVCKSWLDLIEGGKFKTSYTPKPCLGFSSGHMYSVYDDDEGSREPLFQIYLNPPHLVDRQTSVRYRVVIDSADGLVFVRDACNTLFVVNPMTREYVKLPPRPITSRLCIFGFGVSKISRQYKILYGQDKSGSCHVYTLGGGGGGSWRSVPSPSLPPSSAPSPNICIRTTHLCDSAAFLNGNLHWFWVFEAKHWLCCFDLETELLTVFSPPTPDSIDYWPHQYRLFTLEGRLCFSDCNSGCVVVIWQMNSYGDDNSWVKKYTFSLLPPADPRFAGRVFPVKSLDNGDLLFTVDRDRMYIYSKNTENAVLSNFLQHAKYSYSGITVYTPSFLSLKVMGIQNVQPLHLPSPLSQQPRISNTDQPTPSPSPRAI